jgi:hypothetical protein
MLSERPLQVVLVVLGLMHLAMGVLALAAPGTFFDQIGHYGVENDHYVGDVGAFYAAMGIALLVAAGRARWRAPILALFAVWYGLHALNHAFDVDQAKSDARGLFDTIALAVGAAIASWLAWVAHHLERPWGAGPR